jgi:alcohol dehydrogenase (cytochrome c)
MRKTALLVVLFLGLLTSASSQVTYQRVLDATREPQNWLTYSGRYAGWRYSGLDQINTASASRLSTQWAFQVGDLGQFETAPIVVDGVLYGTGQNDRAFALDARTGRAIWRYQRNLPDKIQPCCGMVNRGFAILGDRLFMATLDAHVIALDAKTGNVVWDVTVADYRQGYTFTVAPLAVKNQVIVGASGGEYGIRGFVDAYDAETGQRTWRFETVPGPGQPGHETWAGDSWKTGGSRLAHRNLRSGVELNLLADGKSVARQLWGRSARR